MKTRIRRSPEEFYSDKFNDTRTIFYSAEFDDPSKEQEILAQMPDYEKYLEDKQNLLKRTKQLSIDDDMTICCTEPTLTAEQQHHLFRKMAYIKYKFSLNNDPKLLEQKNQIRDLLALSNLKLMAIVIKKDSKLSKKDKIFREDFFDMALNVMFKSVEYYDWRRGFKFNTYFLSALFRSWFRRKPQIVQKITINISQTQEGEKAIQSISNKEESDLPNIEKMAQLILSQIDDLQIIIKHFGFDGEAETCEEIGSQVSLSKSRVQQRIQAAFKRFRSKYDYETLLGMVEQ